MKKNTGRATVGALKTEGDAVRPSLVPQLTYQLYPIESEKSEQGDWNKTRVNAIDDSEINRRKCSLYTCTVELILPTLTTWLTNSPGGVNALYIRSYVRTSSCTVTRATRKREAGFTSASASGKYKREQKS